MGLSQVPAARAGATRNVVTFTSSTTWTVPSTALYVDVMVVGGGCGGRGGHRSTLNSGNGGTGGAITFLRDIYLGGTGTVSITVGAGSSGTAGSNTTTEATAPSAAGFSAFGTYAYSQGGTAITPGAPGYKGTGNTDASYLFNLDRDFNQWAPLMTVMWSQQFLTNTTPTAAYTATAFGVNSFGFYGGWNGIQTGSTNNRFFAGGSPGLGRTADQNSTISTNTFPIPIPTTYYSGIIGAASAGTSGTSGGAGGAAGVSGLAGGGGACIPVGGSAGAQGGPGAGGGGSYPLSAGNNGGNGGNAGTNTGAGGGNGACTGGTGSGTGGNGGNGGSGLVVVSWIS